MSIAELVLLSVPNTFFQCVRVLLSDICVSIISVVFATVWTTGMTWTGRFDNEVGISLTDAKPPHPYTPRSRPSERTIVIAPDSLDKFSLGGSSVEGFYPLRSVVQQDIEQQVLGPEPDTLSLE